MNLVWWALALIALVALCRCICADALKLEHEAWNAFRRDRFDRESR